MRDCPFLLKLQNTAKLQNISRLLPLLPLGRRWPEGSDEGFSSDLCMGTLIASHSFGTSPQGEKREIAALCKIAAPKA